ncbi:sn-glycerol-3-phosphate ABC transporter substrate-binding protein UgpB [Rhizobium rhizogenes]|uniref:sn-glycerol-3-phosphate-binding periplasmic protein UgpB n=1 Tax=Rhizobium rhizogenes TaxID=359 RepID=A0AA92C4T7_RHIRH|nr:sn-glycerol-3-phosphate ABC transporter substrate-binding protein UgpB [Rhizobium rhizogenes]PVE55536.1 sn-glycerol-3-phosphate ABC transporter substrate-binding protein UgpB [Rhizobium rhizogenes]PVE65541.1 sn-glycerol-3-phosphate ABC transporter substrate-binding protein UgpB [Agrobacterium tumefaciens]PVE75605.1 sn-glycerol-3-phosphate ABC transporter substrate-binding protein UgpB [Sphingomonas sp. TPD3009]
MSTKRLAASAAAFAISLSFGTSAFAATELQWWHAMTGANNEVVDQLAKEFNESQSEYKITPVFKGTYPETLNAGIAAFRSKQPPAVIQVFDAGSGVMMGAEGAIMPVADVLKKGGFEFNKADYLAGIVAYYSKPDGTMLSFPYNSSSPILYYNKDAFKKAGLDTENPPKTWPAVFEAARKIKESGAAPCGFTSTWLTWIQTENFAAWNNVSYGTNENGLGGGKVELKINAPLFVEHFQSIADMAKDGTFRYGGRTSEAKQLFLSGECAILTESSGGLGDIVKSGMNYGIGQLPYYEGHGPQNTIPGGASLWVFGGKSDEEYKGIAQFFHFLSQTPIQARLHQVSGYLPVTNAAYEATKASGFYEKNPARETPILQMMGKAPTENSKGVRLPNLPQVRDIMNEQFEAMLAGKQDAKTTLNQIVERGNAAIAAASK